MNQNVQIFVTFQVSSCTNVRTNWQVTTARRTKRKRVRVPQTKWR